MTVEQLKTLAQENLIQIGGHTVNHYSFKAITIDKQLKELEESKNQLKGWLNREITTFSFPFGEYISESETLVKQAGYKIACTTAPFCYDEGFSSFYVPRFGVDNWSEETLGKKINKWVDSRKNPSRNL
jgi:peptidoglycan/xylan/chitin deacetylase (PgdA/CDA1 family)